MNRIATRAPKDGLSQEERHRILERWNRPPRDRTPRLCLHELVADQVSRSPNAAALIWQGGSLSYSQLESKSNQLARRLQRRGAAADAVVGVFAERSPDLIVALLAILKTGAGYLALDAAYPSQRHAFQLEDAKAVLLLSQTHLRDRLPGASVPVFWLDQEAQATAAGSDRPVSAAVNPENLAYVGYTSGSTGQPKGVMVTHANAVSRVLAPDWLQLDERETVLQTTSISFDVSAFEIWSSLIQGARLALMPAGPVTVEGLGRSLSRSGVTTAWLSAGLFQAVVDSDPASLGGLRQLLTGGDVVPAGHVARVLRRFPGLRVINGYGPTENAIFTCCNAADDPGELGESFFIGGPIADSGAYVVGAEGQLLAVDEVGELLAGGIGLARGYLGQPRVTAERFVPDPFSSRPGSRLYRTGDRSRWLADGRLDFRGRMDDQVKIRGFRVEPGEVEHAIKRLPGVEQAFAVSVADPQGDKRLAAYVVDRPQQASPGKEDRVQQLRHQLADLLPGYMQPSVLILLDELPLNRTGKVDRRALPRPDWSSRASGGPPQTPQEVMMARLWKEVLGVGEIGLLDRFLDLGGHSLAAARVKARVRHESDYDLPLDALLQFTTLAQAASRLQDQSSEEARQQAWAALGRADRTGMAPLSFSQERVWFIDRLAPGTPAYNFQAVVRLEGRLLASALEKTLRALVERHEILRTTFVEEDGLPRQRIHPPGPVDIPLVDISVLPEPVRAREEQRVINALIRRPYDVTRLPLIRWTLVGASPRRHALIHSEHHLIHDGWGFSRLMTEFKEVYAALSQGRPSPLPPLQLQFADLAVMERRRMSGEVLSRGLDFWVDWLKDAPPVLDLPLDRPRPARPSYGGSGSLFQLSGSLHSKLREVSRSNGGTLFMTLMAAFQALLVRSSSQTDFVVGTGAANRLFMESEAHLGMFVNNVALRCDLSGNPSFSELIGRVRGQSLKAFAHQDVPFDKVVEALHPHRDLGWNPIVQALFSFHDSPMPRLDLPDLEGRLEYRMNGTAKFDLNIVVVPGGDVSGEGMAVIWEASADLFNRSSVEGMIRRFRTILEAVAEDDRTRLWDIPLLTSQERRELLERAGRTAPQPEPALVHELFQEQAAATPQAVALVFQGRSIEYADLNRRANRLARALRRRGVAADARVGVCLRRGWELTTALLAVLKAGGAYVPLDPEDPPKRIAFLVGESGLDLALTKSEFEAALPDSLARLHLDREADRIEQESDADPEWRSHPDGLAYVLFTSGSTGRPKGVAVSHRSVVRLVRNSGFADLSPPQVFLQLAPIAFDASTFETWGPLLNGASLVLAPAGQPSLREIGEIIAANGVTTLWLTAGLFNSMVDENPAALTPLKQLLAGGEALSPPHVEKALQVLPATRLINGYGPTEATTFTTTFGLSGLQGFPSSVPLGRPIANTPVYLLDPQMRLAPDGIAGEICIAGPGLARGYLGRPALTADRFRPNPIGEGGSRLYRSGDLARWNAKGELEFLGRIDQQVKVRGFRIEPEEVEAALVEHPQVRQAALLAHEGSSGEKRLAAYIVALFSHDDWSDELRGFLRDRLPDYMQPAFFVPLDELPLTPNGKVDRRALRGLGTPPQRADRTAAAPLDPIQARIAAIWSELLEREEIGPQDDFFDLGGHSLMATRVLSRIQRSFGIDLSLSRLFECSLLGQLAKSVEGALPKAPAPPLKPRGAAGPAPLSFAQQRLWFLDRLTPDNPFYNIPASWIIRGKLDVGTLRRSLNALQRRQHSLRTRFLRQGEQPIQVVDPARGLDLAQVDLRGLPEPAIQGEADRLARLQARRPFDLTISPLLRTTLLRLADERALLLATFHHIIADGWSLEVFLRDLAAGGRLDSRTVPQGKAAGGDELEEIPLQYIDFALWQRDWLRGSALESQLAYWERQLQGAAPLDLPTDYARPEVQAFRGGRLQLRLSSQDSQQLRRLGRRHGATLFMTLLAAFQTLLHRCSGQDDIVVGTPIANRSHPGLEGLIGFFANTLAIRSDLSQDPTFTQLLEQVSATALEAYTHQDLPFEKLVERLQPERDLSRNPVFQVILAFQSAPRPEVEAGRISIRQSPSAGRTTRFDLELHAWEGAEGIEGFLSYDLDLFKPGTIERLAGHLVRLLQGAIENPRRRLSELPLLSSQERLQLSRWNRSQRPAPFKPVHVIAREQAQRKPEDTAIVFGSRRLSYAQLECRANQLAHRLRRLGVGPDARTAISMDRSPEMIVAVLAVLKAGGAWAPLDPAYPEERLELILRDCQCAALVVDADSSLQPPAGVGPRLEIGPEWGDLSQENPEPPQVEVGPENLAYVIYTSGSTGIPKGVAMPHRGLSNLIRWQLGEEGLTKPRTTLQFTSLSFDVSVQEIFSTFAAGGALVMVDEDTRLDPSALLRVLVEERVERVFMPPAALLQLAETGVELDLRPPLREIVAAGEQLKVNESFRRWLSAMPGCRLANHYGPTETHLATILELQGDPEGHPALPDIGWPLANQQAYPLDRRLNPMPPGIPGELFLAGEGLARGYWRRPSLTAQRFLPNPQGPPGSRMYRSGDLVRYVEPDGCLRYLGRTDHQVKVRGFRVEPGEIESALRQYPTVREAAVIAMPDPSGNNRLTAYVAAQEGAKLLEDELAGFLSEMLPAYMVPSLFVYLDRLPLTNNGKLDRKALPLPEEAGRSGKEYEAPRDRAETLVAGIFQEVLGLQRVGLRDDFFELGGHSLLATQVISRVRRAFGLELPLRALFEASSVAAFAGRISHSIPEAETPAIQAAPRQGPIPLSFAQQRLWFLDQLTPDNPFYNIAAAWELKGPLDVDAMQASLSQLVERHEALRTRFGLEEGEPCQKILPGQANPLPVVDLSGLPVQERQQEGRRLASRESARPFDLGRDRLMRTLLIVSDAGPLPSASLLLASFHHIVADGWSMGVFMRELSTLYQRNSQSRLGGGDSVAPPLPELPFQYADFAVWQRQLMQGEWLQEQLGYWEERLRDVRALDLPADWPRPAVQRFRGGRLGFRLPRELCEGLQRLSQRRGVTLFMTLLAAFQTLLHRYSGQDDIVVGSPIANRNYPGLEELIGFFVNTLAMRGDLSGDPRFEGLLEQANRTALEAFAHQDLPFERLVEHLQPDRDLSRNPVFQVVLSLQNAPRPVERLAGLNMRLLPLEVHTTRFDLELHIWDGEEGFKGLLSFDRDLFEAASMQLMLDHYKTLLAAIVNDPNQRLSKLNLLGPDERRQLIQDWSGRELPLPRPALIHGLFRQRALEQPQAPALCSQGESLSYADLENRSNQLAHRLRSLGIRAEHCVGVCLSRCPDLVISVLAVLKAGGAYVPLDPELPEERLGLMLDDSQATLLLTHSDLDHLFYGQPRRIIRLDAEWDSIRSESEQPLLSQGLQADEAGLAYLIYTSGSTGRPKGVAVTHRNVVRLVHGIDYAEMGSQEVVLQNSNFAFDVSTFEIWATLINGGRLVQQPIPLPSLAELEAIISQEGVSTLWLTSGVFHQMVEENPQALRGLRQLFAGGDALSPVLVETILREAPELCLINGYGPTENTTFTTCHPMRGPQRMPGTTPLGRPVGNCKVYLLDRNQELAPQGVPAELCTSGAGLSRGYLGQPARTAERFLPNPFGPAGSRLYRSGDLARWRPDGTLHFLGRIDHQVKIRGFRVEPGEVEAVLSHYPTLREVAVVPQSDASGNKRLVAYVVADEGSKFLQEELSGYLSEVLPAYMAPAFFVQLDRLPLTANGKLDRRALPEPDGAAQRQGRFVAPSDAVESRLVRVWETLLAADRVGVEDDFFDLGGHSLLATQVISQVRRDFEVELPLRALFEAPTVSALARRIRSSSPQAQTPAIVPVERDGDLPLSFAQQRLWFLDQLTPGNPFYNSPAFWRLSGRLDTGALRRSLAATVARHEALRTTFQSQDGRPRQVIAEPGEQPLLEIDLRALPEDSKRIERQRLIAREARRPFDLSRHRLIRPFLMLLDREEQALLVLTHHIVSDGFSNGILLRELASFYAQPAGIEASSDQGAAPRAEPLPYQYVDFAAWQRAWLTGPVLERQLSYWQERLSGVPRLELHTDHPRPATKGYQGLREPIQVAQPLTAALEELSQSRDATLFMTLLASLQTLLHRWSGQNDIVVGSPIANRNHPGLDKLIGFFVNTLALRADLSGDPAFDDLLEQVSQSALDAYAHQDLPFEKLVEHLQPERDLGREPVFQVMFSYQGDPIPKLAMRGLEASPLPASSRTARYDLEIQLWKDSKGLRGDLIWDADLFERETMRRFLDHWGRLLQGIADDSACRLSRLPLLGAEERRQVLDDWNDSRREWTEAPLHELFNAQARRSPQAVAASFQGGEVTYSQLQARADRLAHRLRAAGVGPEAVIAICLPRSLELAVGLLGILKSGAGYLPIDPELPSQRLREICQDARPAAVLCSGRTPPSLEQIEVDHIPLDESGPCPHKVEPAAFGVGLENAAYVLFTSGSSGRPKGVAVSHRAAANHMLWMRERFPMGPGSRVLQKTALGFDASVWEFFAPWIQGGEAALAAPGAERDSAQLVREIGQRRITHLQMVPSALDILLREAELSRCRTLEFLFSGGEALGDDLRRRVGQVLPHAALINLYGPTEATIDAAYWDSSREAEGPGAPIGRPIANLKTFVLDPHLRPAPIGVPGELCISGRGLSRGYLRRPGWTAERFLPDPYSSSPGARLYRSGDRARWRRDGNLEFLGRLDAQLKLRGFRIELGEIESALAAIEGVAQAAAAAWPDDRGGVRLAGYVRAEGGQRLEEAELRSRLERNLPVYMIPSALVSVEEFPLTSGGKIKRRALPAPQDWVRRSSQSIPPQTSVEKRLAQLWHSILGVEGIGVEDGFFELGGHSLLGARVMAEARKAFRVELPLRLLFESPRLGALAQRIEESLSQSPQMRAGSDEHEAKRPAERYLVKLQKQGEGTPFFCVHPAGGGVSSYLPLAQGLGTDQPFYALDSPQAEDSPDDLSIEEMADRYLQAVRAVRPQGPYVLGGHSLGGTIAFEMARQLRREGQEVALLVLLDAFPPGLISPRPHGIEAAYAFALALAVDPFGLERRHLERLSPQEQREEILGMAEQQGKIASPQEADAARRRFRRITAHLGAFHRYDPQPCRLNALLVSAERRLEGEVREAPRIAAQGWRRLLGADPESLTASGHHADMLSQAQVGPLAEGLRSRLRLTRVPAG